MFYPLGSGVLLVWKPKEQIKQHLSRIQEDGTGIFYCECSGGAALTAALKLSTEPQHIGIPLESQWNPTCFWVVTGGHVDFQHLDTQFSPVRRKWLHRHKPSNLRHHLQ